MYQVDLQSIHFSNGKHHNFKTEIAESLDFEESIVVRLVSGPFALFQNIFGFDYRGNLLWSMPRPRSFIANNPWVSLFRKGGFLEVLNWDGHIVTLHPKLGTIVGEDYYDGDVSNHRTASRRRWM